VISIDTEARILRLHRGGYTAQQIADKVGCCGQAVRTVISFGEIRPREEIERQREPPYTSTPQQIKDECAKIRAGWDDTTRQSRDQYPVAPWSAPLVNTPPGQFFEWTDTTNLCNNGDADDSP